MATSWSLPVGSGEEWPEHYERGRPGWPREVFDLLDLPASATVLDLGAGTGKLTRLLAETYARVVAVEPADAMRAVLVRLCPDVEALAGTAEEIPLDDESVDVVFVAEAFHKLGTAAAVAEMARVLRSRGALVLLWNLPAAPTEPSVAEAEEFLLRRAPGGRGELGYDPVDLNTTVYESGSWRAAFAGSPFEELREARLPNPQRIDRDGLVAFYASMGWFGDLPDDERLALADQVRELLSASEYHRRWETHVLWTRVAA